MKVFTDVPFNMQCLAERMKERMRYGLLLLDITEHTPSIYLDGFTMTPPDGTLVNITCGFTSNNFYYMMLTESRFSLIYVHDMIFPDMSGIGVEYKQKVNKF